MSDKEACLVDCVAYHKSIGCSYKLSCPFLHRELPADVCRYFWLIIYSPDVMIMCSQCNVGPIWAARDVVITTAPSIIPHLKPFFLLPGNVWYCTQYLKKCHL